MKKVKISEKEMREVTKFIQKHFGKNVKIGKGRVGK